MALMRCLDCEYALEGLPAGPCPECGRAFDPSNPETYVNGRSMDPATARRWGRRLELAGLVAAGWVLVWFGLMHVMLLVARVSLGHWPHRMGRDDPKHIDGLTPLHLATMLCMLATPIALMSNLALIGWVASMRQWPRVLRMAIAMIGLWLLGVVLVRWDPARVGVWFMD